MAAPVINFEMSRGHKRVVQFMLVEALLSVPEVDTESLLESFLGDDS